MINTKKTRSKRQRKSSKNRLDFETLEKRQLLATLVADFQSDFPAAGQAPSDGWSYQWNAPNGWTDSGNPGNLASGAIDDPSTNFIDLQSAGGTNWTPDGDMNGLNNTPAGFVRLSANGGVAGPGGYNSPFTNQQDRFAIAAYTVSESGYYTLTDSFLSANGSADGVEVLVFVNRDAPVETALDEDIGNDDAVIYFDTELGYLVAGDTVHVAFGPNVHHNSDYFSADFSIERHEEREQVIADYDADFSTGTPSEGWQYLWNAPDGWAPNGSSGNATTGVIGDVDSYRPLVSTGTMWTPDGDTAGNHNPDYYLRLAQNFAHPGQGYSSSFYADRYAIAAFTVPHSGLYGIQGSELSLTSSSNDGVEVYVHVDDGPMINDAPIFATTANNHVSFDMNLGFLQKGETVYVAHGARNNHNSDSFDTDFKIVRMVPRAEPKLDLLDVDFDNAANAEVIHVTGTTADDWQEIRDALDSARSKVYNDPNVDYVEIRLATGTYNISSSGSTESLAEFFPNGVRNNRPYFGLPTYKDILFNGQDSTFIADDYHRGMFANYGAGNFIYKDLTIDYAEFVNGKYKPLTFTQGIISNVNVINDHQVSFELDVDLTEFFAPDSSFESANVESGFGYLVDPEVDGRLKDAAEWQYTTLDVQALSNGKHKITSHGRTTTGLSQFANGDRYVMQRRVNRSLFIASHDATDVSLIGIDVYTAPSVFVGGQHANNVNVIDSNVIIRPNSNRWKSINADGIHIQSNRTGAWVENTKFEGLGDDVMNFYTIPTTIHEIVAGTNNTQIEVSMFSIKNLVQTYESAYEIGDHLTFVNPLEGEVLKKARITNVQNGSNVWEDSNFDGIQQSWEVFETKRLTLDQSLPASEIVTGTFANTNSHSDPSWRDDTTIYNDDLSQGFLVQDSVLSNSRRYGNFVMSDNGYMVDNVYEGLSDQAIAGHSENAWPLGLYADDILVQGNDFFHNGFSDRYRNIDYQRAVVSFNMDRYDLAGEANDMTDAVVDRSEYEYTDIQIRDNVFYHWSRSAISVRNAERVTVADNTILAGVDNPIRDNAFEVQYTKDVTLENNAVADWGYTALFANNDNFSETGRTNVDDAKRVWLTFDEHSGNVTTDESGNGHNGTLYGGNYSMDADGRLESGASFDGNGAVWLNDGMNFGFINQRTISMWFKADNVSGQKQVVYEEGSFALGLNIYIDSGQLYVGRWQNGSSNAFLNTAVEAGKWNHVSLVLDGNSNQLRGYLNGTRFDSMYATRINAHGGSISLARVDQNGTRFHNSSTTSPGFGLAGSIDDLRIYDTALTDSEVSALALRPKSSTGIPSTLPQTPPGMPPL